MSDSNIEDFIDKLLIENEFLGGWIDTIDEMLMPFAEEDSHRQLLSIKEAYIHILCTVRSSGLLDEGYIRWLHQVKVEKLIAAYREIEEFKLLMKEVHVHLVRITALFKPLVANAEFSTIVNEKLIVQGLKKIGTFRSSH